MATFKIAALEGGGKKKEELKQEPKKPMALKPIAPASKPVVQAAEIKTPEVVAQEQVIETPKAETTIATVEPVKEEDKQQPTKMDIQKQIAATARQAKIDALKQKFNTIVQGADQDQAALTDRFRQQESRIGVEDVMARTGAAKSRAVGGLGQAGAIGQSETAQSVITQGALSTSRAQEQQQRQAIEQRVAEARQAMASGIATAQTEEELTLLQNQLDAINAQEAADMKSAELQSQRDFEIYKMNLDTMNDQSILMLKNELDRENTILDAQIQEARDNRNFAQAQALEAQKTANNVKLEGIKQAGRMALEEARSTLTPEEQRMQELELRNQELRNQGLEQDLAGGTTEVQTIPNDVLNILESRYVSNLGGQSTVDTEGMFQAVKELVMNGNLTLEQGERIEAAYGLGEIPTVGPGTLLNPMLVN